MHLVCADLKWRLLWCASTASAVLMYQVNQVGGIVGIATQPSSQRGRVQFTVTQSDQLLVLLVLFG
jgi:hypothetical protein